MVIKQIRTIKNNNSNIFKIPTILNLYKENFFELFQKFYYQNVFQDGFLQFQIKYIN